MSVGKQVHRKLFADARSIDLHIDVKIGSGHYLDAAKAQELADAIVSEIMKAVASTPGLTCPLSKIKVSGR